MQEACQVFNFIKINEIDVFQLEGVTVMYQCVELVVTIRKEMLHIALVIMIRLLMDKPSII